MIEPEIVSLPLMAILPLMLPMTSSDPSLVTSPLIVIPCVMTDDSSVAGPSSISKSIASLLILLVSSKIDILLEFTVDAVSDIAL